MTALSLPQPSASLQSCPGCGAMLEPEGRWPQPNKSWLNARRAVESVRHSRRVAEYVEGWAVRRYADGKHDVVPHAWIDIPEHGLFDPTPHHHCVAYFEVLRTRDPQRLAVVRDLPVTAFFLRDDPAT